MTSKLRAPRLAPLNAFLLIGAAAVTVAITAPAQASSHREAPFITTHPKVDGTDFYMFNSYEPGRAGYVTLIANYQPFEDPQGGPNYYTMDPKALYEIHIDNNGDGHEDLTFQFRFKVADSGLAVMAGGKPIPVPLSNIGQLSAASTAAQNVIETYSVTLVRGDRRTGQAAAVTNAVTGSATFSKPFDNVGVKSIPDYAAYASNFIYTVNMVIMVITGGKGTLAGPIVGGVIFGFLPVILRPFAAPAVQWILYGGLMIAIVFVLPQGIVPALQRWIASRRTRTPASAMLAGSSKPREGR